MASIVTRKRKDGTPSYYVKYVAGDGKERWERFTRKHDAQARKAEVELELARSGRSWSPPTTRTFDEVADAWLQRRRVSARTLKNHRGIVDKHLRPEFGDSPVARIKRSDVDALAARLSNEGMAQGTIGQVIAVLRQILGMLVLDDELHRNVAARIKPQGRKTNKPKPPTDAQLAKLLAAMRADARPVVEFAAASGLRRSEVFALRWRDVDFTAREINVARSKTEAGERRVPMFGSMRKLLLERKAASRFKRPDDFVFATVVGTQENANRWYEREFVPARDRAGLSVRFHDLRHYAVSKLIEQGANILLVSRVAGHARASMTLDVYAHLLVDGLSEAATRFDPLRTSERLRAVDER